MADEINRIKKIYEQRNNALKIDYNPLLPANYYLLNSREKPLLKLIKKYYQSNLNNINFLDVGFGGGFDLLTVLKYGIDVKNINGVEVLEERYLRMKGILPAANLKLIDGFILPFANESMDLIIQSTVFSSILEPEARFKLATEMYRVLKKGGKIFSYDLRINNPWNKNVIKIDKAEYKQLFPDGAINLYPVTLNPLVVRKIAPISIILCELLEKFSPLCSHYYCVISKT